MCTNTHTHAQKELLKVLQKILPHPLQADPWLAVSWDEWCLHHWIHECGPVRSGKAAALLGSQLKSCGGSPILSWYQCGCWTCRLGSGYFVTTQLWVACLPLHPPPTGSFAGGWGCRGYHWASVGCYPRKRPAEVAYPLLVQVLCVS